MKIFAIGIVGILVITTSLWMWNKNPVVKNSVTAQPVTAKTTYADQFKGQTTQIKILYTSKENKFSQKEFILTSKDNSLAKSLRSDLFNAKDYLVTYMIENPQDNFIELKIRPSKNVISISGIAPQSTISIWNDKNSILNKTPVDWSGKLLVNTVDKNNMRLANAQTICIYLQSEDLEICHSPIQNREDII